MNTKEEALELEKEILPRLIVWGTEIDEFYRKVRELRLRTDDLAFQSALLKVEHSLFMVVQSLNVLREQLSLLETAAKKKEIE